MATVMLIEDNAQLTRLNQIALHEAGFKTIAAADCAEALDILSQTTPDLIILDMALPDGNGLSLIRHLKSSGQFKNTQIIVVTGGSHYQETAAQEGIEYFIQKPVEIPMLLELVQRLAAAHSSRRK